MILGILIVFYIVWRMLNYRKSELKLIVGDIHSVPMYSDPKEELRDKKIARVERIKERFEGGGLSIKVMKKLSEELDQLHIDLEKLR